MGLRTEHYYTCRGRQRAVFLRPEAVTARFAVELLEGDEGRVEVSYDPVETVRKGRGEWVPFEGGLAGGVAGATALRVNVGKVEGWVKLMVQQG